MGLRHKHEDSIPLKNLIPLGALSDEQLGGLLAHVSLEKAKRGEYLFREGDDDAQYVYVLSGKVALLAGGKEEETVTGGTPAARMALAHYFPRRYSARAKGRVQFLRIDNRHVSRLQQENDAVAYEVSDIENEKGGDWMTHALRSTLFQRIPTANLQRLLRHMRKKDLAQGEVVIKEGDRGDSFFIIGDGSCQVTRKEARDGRTIEVARLGVGDSFGEEALLFGQRRHGTVTMVTDGVLAEITKSDFIQLIARPLCQEVEYTTAEALIGTGALWIDIRDPRAFAGEHLENALNIPLDSVRGQGATLDRTRNYIVCGDDKTQCVAAAFWLNQQGLSVVVLQPTVAELFGKVPEGVAEDPESTPQSGAEPGSGHDAADVVELKMLRHRLEAMEQDMAVLKKQNSDGKAEMARIGKKKAALETSLATAAEELANLQQQMADKLVELRQYERDASAWAEQRGRLEQQLNEAREHARMVEAERDRLLSEMQRLQARLDRVEAAHAEQEGRLKEEMTLLGLKLEEARAGKGEEEPDERIVALTRALEEKDRRLRQQAERHREYLDELKTVRATLAEQEARQASMKAQFQIDLGDLEQALDAALDARQQAEAQLQAQRAQHDEVQQALAHAQEELTEWRNRYEAAVADLKEEKRRHEAARRRLQEVLDSQAGPDPERERLSLALEQAEADLAEKEAELNRLQGAVAEGEQRLKVSAEDAQQQLLRMRQEIGELRSALADRDERIRQAESGQRVLEQRLAQSGETDLARLQRELKAAHAQLAARMEAELSVAEERETAHQRIRAAEEELEEMSRRHEALAVEHRNLQKTLESLRTDRDRLQDASSAWKQEVDEAREQNRILEQNIERLEVQLRAAQNRNQYERFSPPPESAERPRGVGRLLIVASIALMLGAACTFGAIDAWMTASGDVGLVERIRGQGAGEPSSPSRKHGSLQAKTALLPSVSTRPKGVEMAKPVSREHEKQKPKPATAPPEAKRGRVVQDRLADGGNGPVMVGIPGGVFAMGDKGVLAAAVEQPVHPVHVEGFLMSRNEITFDDYDLFARATGREAPDDDGWGRGRHPVVNVTWEDAVAYAEWLSQQSGHRYRLPSEAQWEYAAAAGHRSRYWWGDAPGRGHAVCAGCGSPWDEQGAAPVGSLAANPFGLHDMAGNVMEWTEDCFNPGYEGAPADGGPWLTGDCSRRMVRGGAFNTPPEKMRSAHREAFSADDSFSMVGFRLVRLD